MDRSSTVTPYYMRFKYIGTFISAVVQRAWAFARDYFAYLKQVMDETDLSSLNAFAKAISAAHEQGNIMYSFWQWWICCNFKSFAMRLLKRNCKSLKRQTKSG